MFLNICSLDEFMLFYFCKDFYKEDDWCLFVIVFRKNLLASRFIKIAVQIYSWVNFFVSKGEWKSVVIDFLGRKK